MRTFRRALPLALAVLGAFLLLGTAGLLVAWPGLLTGHACELTITSVDVDVEGAIRIEYRAWLAYDTVVVSAAPVAPGTITCTADYKSWRECPPRFLRHARLATDGHIGTFAREDPSAWREGGDPDVEAIRARLAVAPGTYRVRPGGDLVYWRGRTRDGREVEGRFTVRFAP